MSRGSQPFGAVYVEGTILPPDILQAVAAEDRELGGLNPTDYNLARTERLNEAISRSWTRLTGLWASFKEALEKTAESEPAIGLTRERWLLPLFQELGFGKLQLHRFEIDGKPYPVSHLWERVPIHLLGANVELDRRTRGVAGAAALSPHSLVQELVNRSEDHLWAMLSNGRALRVLRDNASLSRQAYVEFDLEAIFEGEAYSDFRLLWLVCHATRFEGETPAKCCLERWSKAAAERGTRALDSLRDGVEQALEALGSGFLAHISNQALRDRLRSGEFSKDEYFRQLLRLVYRLLFLFVAEDRGLLLDPEAPADARARYLEHYSAGRLRRLAVRRRPGRHSDLWQALRTVMGVLREDECAGLALRPLGSFLWSGEAMSDLEGADLANRHLLDAVHALSWVKDGGALRAVDYKNLGAEELGSIYESLLELHPDLNLDAATFELRVAAGHERKTSGSYYTPDSLVQCLLDSALDPVVEEAVHGKTTTEAEKAILDLKVCDPAVGSGHFLVAAAHRLARHLAGVRAERNGESEPSPPVYRTALRDVIGRCLYGVDVNPMAAELCRVSLWLEALEPGKPLSFLDHHIRVGNSLLGATPELIKEGIPDGAFTPIEGDDRATCSALKRRNKLEREGQRGMLHLMVAERPGGYDAILAGARKIDEASDGTIDEVQHKAKQFRALTTAPDYRHAWLLADAWCAAFVWEKQPGLPGEPITTETIRRMEANDGALTKKQREEVVRLAAQFRFFHWHLAFPEVFAKGGFDCVLGNPPWERTAFEAVPYFLSRAPQVAAAETTAMRETLIADLRESDPGLWGQYKHDLRRSKGSDNFFLGSGRFPYSASGRTNTFALFAELSLVTANSKGHVGLVIPSALATDVPYAAFWSDIVDHRCLVSMFDFENRGVFFPNVHSSYKFSLFTFRPSKNEGTRSVFGFFLTDPLEARSAKKTFGLRQEDVASINPITKLLPVCRTIDDFVLLAALHRRSELLTVGASAWVGLTSSATSSDWKFNNQEDSPPPGFTAMWEAKCIHQFNHRFSSYAHTSREQKLSGAPVNVQDLTDAATTVVTRYHIPTAVWSTHQANRQPFSSGACGYRDVARSTDEKTMIAAIVPFAGFMQPLNGISRETPGGLLWLVACLNSFVLDFACRQKTPGAHVNVTTCKQLPIVWSAEHSEVAIPVGGDFAWWIRQRALELTYTAWDLEPFAHDCGWHAPPFRWDEDRRFLLRCELDAAFFHLYLPATTDGQWTPARIANGNVRDETHEELAELERHFPSPRDAVAYMMETFPIVKRKDEQAHGSYRTKNTILSIYDDMQRAIATGVPYQTRLDPPPADPRCAHPESTRPDWAKPATKRIYAIPAPEKLKAAKPDNEWPSELVLEQQSAMAPSRPAGAPEDRSSSRPDPLPLVLDYLRTHPGPHSKSDILSALNLDPDLWPLIRDALSSHPDILTTGEKRGTRYQMRGHDDA